MNKNRAAALFFAFASLGTAAWAFQLGQTRQATVLEKIMAVEARLAANNTQGARANAFTLREIARNVAFNRNAVKDVAVLAASQQIMTRYQTLADTLRAWQRQLRRAAHEEPGGPLLHPETPMDLHAGNAARLARHLNGYSEFIRAYEPAAPVLAPDTPVFPESTWLYYDHSPLAAALASITYLEAQALRLATSALQRQAEKVASSCCGFNIIRAMAVPAATTVAPGAVYDAQLFLTQSEAGYKRSMSVNGQPIDVINGQGKVEIKVPALQPNQPDTVRAQWQGIINASTPYGDTAYKLVVPYYIVKPRTR